MSESRRRDGERGYADRQRNSLPPVRFDDVEKPVRAQPMTDGASSLDFARHGAFRFQLQG
jgi:hypothetical protein